MADAKQAPASRVTPEGHGWWAYLVPYVAFLLLIELTLRLPVAVQPWMLFVKPAVPALVIAWFYWKGAYPELRGFDWKPGGVVLDVLVGLATAVVWVAPYLLIQALPRPDASEGFDPLQAGEAAMPWLLAARLAGFALVTPVFEELFIRSFVIRVAEVFRTRGDFRDVPIAHYTRGSFWAMVIIFTVGHAPWEWWVSVPWIVLTTLWFFHRGHLMSVIVVHGVTNAAIFFWVLWVTGGPRDGVGSAFWVFL